MKRTLIFTGEGKGKTTAALGAVLRASGHGQRTLIVQFIKADARVGELSACAKLPGVEIVQMGYGVLPDESSPEFHKHRKAAAKALAFTERAFDTGKYDLIVLDEVCVAVEKRLIDEDRVLELLQHRRGVSCVILTGRGASMRMMKNADTITEMHCVRHGLHHGKKSQRGVEY